jgi:hypothetical protein
LFALFVFNFLNSLYILDINRMFDEVLANIFSHSKGYSSDCFLWYAEAFLFDAIPFLDFCSYFLCNCKIIVYACIFKCFPYVSLQ